MQECSFNIDTSTMRPTKHIATSVNRDFHFYNRPKNLDSVLNGERGGSVVECRTPEREVGGSKPTAAVLCPLLPESTG